MQADGARCFVTITEVDSHRAALQLLRTDAVHAVIVYREVPRAALFHCPCGCGEVLTVNLDPRAGAAWRWKRDGEGLTLLPSVRRTSGCASHFIVWRGRLWWCADEAATGRASTTWPIALGHALRRGQ